MDAQSGSNCKQKPALSRRWGGLWYSLRWATGRLRQGPVVDGTLHSVIAPGAFFSWGHGFLGGPVKFCCCPAASKSPHTHLCLWWWELALGMSGGLLPASHGACRRQLPRLVCLELGGVFVARAVQVQLRFSWMEQAGCLLPSITPRLWEFHLVCFVSSQARPVGSYFVVDNGGCMEGAGCGVGDYPVLIWSDEHQQ